RVAARRLRSAAAAGPHAPAPASHARGAAAAPPRGAADRIAARPAGADREGRPGTVSRVARTVACGALAHASGRRRVGARAGRVAVARARALPARAAPSRVARRRARDLPGRRAPVLVAGRAAVAEPCALATLDDPGLPAPRRRPEHHLRGAP